MVEQNSRLRKYFVAVGKAPANDIPEGYEEQDGGVWQKEIATWSNEFGFLSLYRRIEVLPKSSQVHRYFYANGDDGEDAVLKAKTLDSALSEVEREMVADDWCGCGVVECDCH
jgi:hypothetical protein